LRGRVRVGVRVSAKGLEMKASENIQNLEGYKTFGTSENTRLEFVRLISFEQMKQNIAKIAKHLNLQEKHVCYVWGGGGNPKSTYQAMYKNNDVSVIFARSCLPVIFKIFGWLIPSHQGLVKINKAGALGPTVDAVVQAEMATIFVFDRKFEAGFLEAVKSYDFRKNSDDSFGVKEDGGYIIYFMDAENWDERVAEVVSLGKDVSHDFVLE
jgi:hypothetical protein